MGVGHAAATWDDDGVVPVRNAYELLELLDVRRRDDDLGEFEGLEGEVVGEVGSLVLVGDDPVGADDSRQRLRD